MSAPPEFRRTPLTAVKSGEYDEQAIQLERLESVTKISRNQSAIRVDRKNTSSISLERKMSTADVIRKASESRILGRSDMKTAERKLAKKGVFISEASPEEVLAGHNEDKDDALPDEEFKYNHHGFSEAEADAQFKIYGPNELPEKKVPLWYIFCSQLWQPMALMIWVAAIIEAALGNYPDMAILFFILFANATIAFYEITKSGNAVAALRASLKPLATVKRNGEWKTVDASILVPGDLVLLATGSSVPADCRVNSHPPGSIAAPPTIDVDQAALTGESLPVTMFTGDSVKMGSMIVKGEVECTVEFTGIETFMGKTASLLGGDPELSNIQKILIHIVTTLTFLSIILCIIVFVYTLQKETVSNALSFTVVLLVASIPIAMEIVTTTTLSVGSKELSHHGAIVTRLAAIEDLAGMSILCSDKTGTLTLNKMVIQDDCPAYAPCIKTRDNLLTFAAMASKWKEPPRDALDTLILGSVNFDTLANVELLDYMPFDPVVKRTQGTVRTSDGQVFKVTKGAPHVILHLACENQADERNALEMKEKVEEAVTQFGLRGVRCVAVARTDTVDGNWYMCGLITFLDPPRPDTKQTIADAVKYGVEVKMITGDHLLIALETARQLDLGLDIASSQELPRLDPVTKKKPEHLSEDYGDYILPKNGFAQVFPEHKYLIVECLREMGYKTGMTGDGVNDAPALKRADVGIAVQGATDAARASADIVLTEPGLSTIIHGIVIARKIFVRIRNFIIYRVAATLQLLIFFFIAVLAMPPIRYQPANQGSNIPGFPDNFDWPNFFHMPVLMLMLITLLNDGTLISIGYDNAIASKIPEKWNIPALFTVGAVMALVACASSLILLECMLRSWQENSIFQTWNLGGLSYGQVITAIYLKVSVSDFLTLFSARTGDKFFFQSAPSPLLLGAATLALSTSTILACLWPESKPDGIYTIGLTSRTPHLFPLYIWIYCIIWWFIQVTLTLSLPRPID
jgi:H+-transporting ATPase